MGENLFCYGQRFSTEAFRDGWDRIFGRYFITLKDLPREKIECKKENGCYRSVVGGQVIDDARILKIEDHE